MPDLRRNVSVRVLPEVHKLVKVAAAQKSLSIGELYELGALRVLRDMGISVPKGVA